MAGKQLKALLVTALWLLALLCIFLLYTGGNQLALYKTQLPSVNERSTQQTQQQRTQQLNSSCASAFLRPSRLQHLPLWQTYRNGNITLQLFGAYYDKRGATTVVRLLAMINQLEQKFPPNYCQLWYEGEPEPHYALITEYRPIWYKDWGVEPSLLYPHLLSCALPKVMAARIPTTVSLVTHSKCANVTNELPVTYEQPVSKAQFGVCIKGLNYAEKDITPQLVEWLELMRLLGAHKVHAYSLNVHANTSRALQYYEAQRYLEVRPLTPAVDNKSLLNKRLNELVPYNDCFYRNMYKYDYIATLDIDEVIMPLGNLTHWSSLVPIAAQMQRAQAKACPRGYVDICFQNIYFPPGALGANAPNYLPMLQHVRRVSTHSERESAMKCFHNTTSALTLHNHYSLSWFNACAPIYLDTAFAQMQHYRRPDKLVKSEELVVDRNIWRFEPALRYAAEQVLKTLGYL